MPSNELDSFPTCFDYLRLPSGLLQWLNVMGIGGDRVPGKKIIGWLRICSSAGSELVIVSEVIW